MRVAFYAIFLTTGYFSLYQYELLVKQEVKQEVKRLNFL